MTQYVFEVQLPNGQRTQHSLGVGTFTLGRERGDVVLGEASTSSNHGRLELSDASAVYVDVGSTNGSFVGAQRLTAPHVMQPGTTVRLGNVGLVLLERVASAPALGPAGTLAMEALPSAAAPGPAPAAAGAARSAAPDPQAHFAGSAPSGNSGGAFSHPGQPVRHSYPLAIQSASLGEAVTLLMKTMPFVLVRLGVLVGMTIAGIIFWGILVGGAILLSKLTPILGGVWVVGLLAAGGALWRFVLRYMLYLIKAAHIAVLTELITTGQINNGTEGMFQYGKRIVTERFGEVNVMFGVDILVHGIVRAFNRTLSWIANLIPLPGLDSAVGIVRRVVYAATTFIDETIFSYNLARGDSNIYQSSQDALVYYAQNSKEVLKTGVWVVILDYVLTFAVWVVMLAPAFVVGLILPGSGGVVTLTMVIVAVLFAGSVRSAVLHPLFLIMVMVKFHTAVRGQSIDPQWDVRLSSASNKFVELKQKAGAWFDSRGTGATGKVA